MTTRAPDILKVLASASLLVLGSIAAANAQVRPNPPSDIFAEGGTTLPSGLLFFDDFNYTVDRLNQSHDAAFLSAGWNSTRRAPQIQDGYIYTRTDVPGYSGQMPGTGRPLWFESRPSLSQNGFNQTDYWLKWNGGGGGSGRLLPSNAWFQFWIFVLDQPGYRSRFHPTRNKWIYPTPDGNYPVSATTYPYLVGIGGNSFSPSFSIVDPTTAAIYPQLTAAAANYQLAPEGDRGKLGPNVGTPANARISPNRWYLLKMHIDISGPQGVWEVWLREMNQPFRKTTEWIGGVTPNFLWPTWVEQRNGMSGFAMPTTVGHVTTDFSNNYDSYVLQSEFAIATSESALPVYTSY